MDAVRDAKERTHQAAGSRWVGLLGRLGLAAQGVSYALVAVLALRLAVGEGGEATDRTGALERIADESFGKVVLILLVAGFAAYAIWRFAQALFDRDHEGENAKALAKRTGEFGRGVLYTGLAVFSVSILLLSLIHI